MRLTLNVLFSSDNAYAQHLGAAMCSLLEHNAEFKTINIYIIENNIAQDAREKLIAITRAYANANIFWIPFEAWEKQLKLNMISHISISSYARLFVASMLPLCVDRVLYLDCDMIVTGSLLDFWNTDLAGNVLGAVQDQVGGPNKTGVGMAEDEPYFNAGMLLIDLEKWRQLQIGEKCLRFIEEHGGRVPHHDQGTLNGVLKGQWLRLPLAYNLMTIHYIFTQKQIKKYFQDPAQFYEDAEIAFAKAHPMILHYTPSFTSRPWVKGCAHPLKGKYWDAVKQTPWADAVPEKNKTPIYIRMVEWRYRSLPY